MKKQMQQLTATDKSQKDDPLQDGIQLTSTTAPSVMRGSSITKNDSVSR